MEDFTRCLEATRGRIDIYWALTDLGTQACLLQSRETFHRFIAPPIRTLAELAHRHGVKFMFHSCGAVRDLIPDLIELGVDILNPIQPAAAGMAPEGLKRRFRRQVVLFTAGSISNISCRWSRRKRCKRRSGGGWGFWAKAAVISSLRRTTCNRIFPQKTFAMYDLDLRTGELPRW